MENAAWRTRLRQWGEDWAGMADAVVDVVIRGAGEASEIATEWMHSLLRPDAAFPLTDLLEGVLLRGGDDDKGARRRVVLGSGERTASFELDDESGDLVVELKPWPPERPIPLLFVRRGKVAVNVAELVREGEGLVARIGGLPPGKYAVHVEPTSPS